MSPTRALARPLLASLFVADGYDALKNPDGRVQMAESAGLTDAQKLVQYNAAAMLGGGALLATGKLPRLSALVLAGTLVPTTWVGHQFWTETDPAAKAQQRTQFLKNLSALGGLLLASADTGGRESVPHAAARVTRRTKRKAAKRLEKAEKRASKLAKRNSKRLPVG